MSSTVDQPEERSQSSPEAAQNIEPVLDLPSDVPTGSVSAVSQEQESSSQLSETAVAAPSEVFDVKPFVEETPLESEAQQPREEITFTSPPPPALVEPPVPDPFLVDDSASSEEDSDNDPSSHPIASDSQLSIHPAEEISLAASTSLSAPAPSSPLPVLSPNLNKSVPPTPTPISDDDEDEEETPEVYLPALVHPTMFLPIPNTDPLTTLLTKYISDPSQRPARDLSGEWQGRDFHTLVMSNSWRALARMARDRIVATDPEDVSLILDLWYLRISSLARLRLTNQASAEMNNLFSVLYSLQPPFARDYLLDKLLPFELEVLHARGKYWAGDHMGYLDALWALVRKCRKKAKEAGKKKSKKSGVDTNAEREMWVERGSRVVLIIASELIEMKDFAAATKLLTPLLNSSLPTPELQSAVARIHLQSGHLTIAAKYFAEVEVNPAAGQVMKDMNTAMLATAEGDWSRAANILQRVLVNDPDNFPAVNNLAVVLLSQGLIKEGIDVLEKALRASPSTVVVAEPFLFNLSTLYELRSLTASQNKRNLLLEVAKWSGDGLKTACLKMPSN
ncbi:hypothetical protein NEOLEDRAFT_1073338 [Neolentinus lepideus HHB14362 ss-1]|uniref:Uncharacterized protein n=1 Tax=Neolentinus lepideus HHB14362 ss-1 TaxID=1314782 RepID=A0A165PVQ7_9AGAM|nr:hypothetical protein NEOLEDRAFT_1073338 [Neolentinus lepideus HHB14362 ss-1]